MSDTPTRALVFTAPCDGCNLLMKAGDTVHEVPEAGVVQIFCDDCFTRRPPGTTRDRKDLLDPGMLELDEGLD